MKFVDTGLAGALVLELEPQTDERGFFARTFCEREFAQRGLCTRFVQGGMSHNPRAETLRGLHFQAPPHAETKIMRCIQGALFDVIVDLRPGSATYCRWFGVELTAANRRALYVPEGFAHGFQTLQAETTVLYQLSSFFEPSAARGVRWDDPAFGIQWPPAAARLISARDRGFEDFRK